MLGVWTPVPPWRMIGDHRRKVSTVMKKADKGTKPGLNPGGVAAMAIVVVTMLYAVLRTWVPTPPAPEPAPPPPPSVASMEPSRFPSSALPPQLLGSMRTALSSPSPGKEELSEVKRQLAAARDLTEVHGICLTAYRPSKSPAGKSSVVRVRVVATRKSGADFVERAIGGFAGHPNFARLSAAKPGWNLQLDLIKSRPMSVKLEELSIMSEGPARFEPGVDGLLATNKVTGKREYFMPGDAFTHSILSMAQLKEHLSTRLGGDLSKWEFGRFRTESQVSAENKWVPLYRGYPVVTEVSPTMLMALAKAGVGYNTKNQLKNGQFTYYYDAATDSLRNHEHPRRDPVKNPYYNEVRHAGGVLLLLDAYAMTGDKAVLATARRALDWFVSVLRDRKLEAGTRASYPYYNKKSKLGGAAIGLYAMSEYRRLTGDKKYDEVARRIARHILSQIQDSGEFFYYSIYLDKPVTTAEENRRLFSFYYPGEAVCGLASYYKNVADENERPEIREKMGLALDYLMKKRPVDHADKFTKLPSDSWLMMGVNELWDVPEFQREDIREFVYRDADEMVRRMYTDSDALFPDYPGAFYYDYGDQPYPDGARAEGLTAAMILAHKSGDIARAKRYEDALWKAALATSRLCNTPESVYFAPNPRRAEGGIRFKLTRQWIRVDSVQHVASFYLRFLRHLFGPGPLPEPNGR